MATQAYRDWVSAGKRWDLAKPISELQTWARTNGVPILGTIGNTDHLTADVPEDHTPFSATAWPVPLPGYIVTAIDLGNIRGLGQAIAAGARAGRYPWLKYMNHSGVHLDSRNGWRESPSSDEHVHLSIRSDWVDRSIGAFEPWGDSMTAAEFLAILKNPEVAKVMRALPWQYVGGGIPAGKSTLGVLSETHAKVSQPPQPPAPVEIDYTKLAAELIRQLAAR